MHAIVKDRISAWYQENRAEIDRSKVADLGALDINGSVKGIIRHAVGFDILEGRGVDVVLKPGEVPVGHQHKYDFVVSTSSFQTCPYPEEYKKEILGLLRVGGKLLLTMCGPKCTCIHSTSPNSYGYKDGVRMSRQQVVDFFSGEFQCLSAEEMIEQPNGDIIYYGMRK